MFFFLSSRRRHTRCALVTGVQTCALPILCGLNDELENAFRLLARGEADRLGNAHARVLWADDLGPTGDHARLDEAESAKCRAPDLRHQVTDRPRTAPARALIEPRRLALASGRCVVRRLVPFHFALPNAIACA